jgi:hypothetical protein
MGFGRHLVIHISIIFLREKWPARILILLFGTLKYSAMALTIAKLALPLTGGSFTEITKLLSSSFSIFSSREEGLAITLIFIVKLLYHLLTFCEKTTTLVCSEMFGISITKGGGFMNHAGTIIFQLVVAIAGLLIASLGNTYNSKVIVGFGAAVAGFAFGDMGYNGVAIHYNVAHQCAEKWLGLHQVIAFMACWLIAWAVVILVNTHLRKEL